MELRGKNVLITGGTAGIGLQLAHDLNDRGANVMICGRASTRLARLQDDHPDLHPCACDVRDHESVLALRDRARRTIGVPDLLFNNAAIFQRLGLRDSSLASWLDEVDINLMGTLRVTHAFLPDLTAQPSATILNLTSPSAYLPLAAAPVYSATKAAIHSWTMSLRHQLRDTGVRVVELNPPAVDTRMNENNPDVADLKIWSVQDFSRHVIARLERRGDRDILVGDAKLVRNLSRVAPGMVFRKMNPTRA